MTYLTRERARELAQAEVGPCLSLYLDFRDTRTAEGEERRARLARALERIPAADGSLAPNPDLLGSLVDPVRALLDWSRFWRHQSLGLAIFSSAALCRAFRLPLRVPTDLRIGPRFDLRLALPLLADGARMRLLVLAEEYTRLYESTAEACRLLDWYDLPLGVDDALGFDGRRRSLRFHDGRGWRRGASMAGATPRSWIRPLARGIERLDFGREVPLVVGGQPALVREVVGSLGPGGARALDARSLGRNPSCAAVCRAVQEELRHRASRAREESRGWHPDASSAASAGP